MKFFNQKISLKQVFIVTIVLLLGNVGKLHLLHTVRTKSDIDFYDYFDHLSVFLFTVVAVLSVLISWELIKKIDKTNTILRFLKVYFLSFVIFNCIAIIVDFLLWASVNTGKYDLVLRFFNTISVAFVLIDIFALTSAFLYFRQSQKTALELEQTEKEKATLQSKMLQKNLEPHFLFNNLSVLSGLAKKKPEQIEDFIDDFSDVYRYYLKHGKKQLVELKDELLFLKSYMSLMEKRFGKAYQMTNEIENTNGFVIPCSLQLCIENAIKHNKANEDNPLFILLKRKDDTITITNKLNKVDFTLGTGTGNDYLQRQYQINFDKDVIFTETDKEFTVKIPLIQ